VFRGYACPSCGLLIQTELARPTDPPLWDIRLAFSGGDHDFGTSPR
jgi:acetone carboxylase gamma subunit